MNQIEKFLARLRSSHPDMDIIYTNGACFDLFLMMRIIWPQARAWYAPIPGHVYIEIDGKFYDINGKHAHIPKEAYDFAAREPRRMHDAFRWSSRTARYAGAKPVPELYDYEDHEEHDEGNIWRERFWAIIIVVVGVLTVTAFTSNW